MSCGYLIFVLLSKVIQNWKFANQKCYFEWYKSINKFRNHSKLFLNLLYWVLGPTVWKINPINADMIENGDFEKFPNQKLYLEWLEIKNQTRKWFEIISNIIVLCFGAKSLRYEEFHFRDISEPKMTISEPQQSSKMRKEHWKV